MKNFVSIISDLVEDIFFCIKLAMYVGVIIGIIYCMFLAVLYPFILLIKAFK